MNKITGRSNFSHSLLLATLLLLCFTGTLASRAKHASESVPLRYRLIVSEPIVCQAPNTSIQLDLELENTSQEKLLIDPKGLLYQVNISGKGRGRLTTGDNLGTPKPDAFIPLAPGESYRSTVAYDLGEKPSIPGVYKIEATYGQFAGSNSATAGLYRGSISSNAVLFEIQYCHDQE
jgi:hypothetical protein